MSSYKSKHTGPKIDEAVDRASKYGLGGVYDGYIDDFNTKVQTGWYRASGASLNYPVKPGTGNNLSYGVLRVERRESLIHQFYNVERYGNPISLRRFSSDGGNTWSEWRYENPRMQIGVEYRTTELHDDKPVYVKLVDLGSCPSSGIKNVTVLGDTEVGFRCEGTWTYGGGSTLPFESTSSDRMAIAILGKTVRIFTGGKDFSQYTAKATIYYTKTTD